QKPRGGDILVAPSFSWGNKYRELSSAVSTAHLSCLQHSCIVQRFPQLKLGASRMSPLRGSSQIPRPARVKIVSMNASILREILTSRVYDVARETALDFAPQLSGRLGNGVWLKREDQQPVFSFKLRGAYNRIARFSQAERARGVIAASAGNHAQGVALSARKLGIRALIVMPNTTPEIKVQAVRALGAEVVLAGDHYSEAQQHCEKLAAENGMTFVHPFDDPLVIAGQGTIGDEILRQRPEGLSGIFAPIGGGGLIAGIAAYVKSLLPEIKVIGVQPQDSDAMH